MKRIFVLASIALVAMGAAACTREKPPVTAPTPAALVAPEVTTSTSVPGSGVASSTTPAALTPLIPVPTETSVPSPTLPASPSLWTPVVVPSAMPPPVPTATVSPPGTASAYTVQWGDWLNKIAARFGVTSQAILAANPGVDPNRIYPGQVLNIPAAGASTSSPSTPTTYTGQRGDWFYAIARKFGVSVAALQAANPGVNPNMVYPGQVLNIPSSGPTLPAPVPTPGTPSSYTVRPGDTLFSMAVRFRTTPYALQIANHLANPNFIYPGQTLIIP